MKWQEFIACERYSWRHKIAFLKTERQLLGHNTWRGYMHDIDKLLYLYPAALIFGRTKKWASARHRNHSHHHVENAHKKCRADYIEMIIDWECARYTKPDKPMNAYETMNKLYPQMRAHLLPIMQELGLV